MSSEKVNSQKTFADTKYIPLSNFDSVTNNGYNHNMFYDTLFPPS